MNSEKMSGKYSPRARSLCAVNLHGLCNTVQSEAMGASPRCIPTQNYVKPRTHVPPHKQLLYRKLRTPGTTPNMDTRRGKKFGEPKKVQCSVYVTDTNSITWLSVPVGNDVHVKNTRTAVMYALSFCTYSCILIYFGAFSYCKWPRRRWEDGIKMDLRKIGWCGLQWTHLAQDRDRWRAVVSAVMNLRVLAPRS
jgi:hypothetical protein